MRIVVAGFQHETNTFAQRAADWPAFMGGEFFPAFASGPGFLEAGRHVGLPIWGFVQAARAAGDVIVESCWAGASPCGPLVAHAFESIRRRIVSDIQAALRHGAVDAIYLDLHGAAVAEGCDAPEVALLASLREVIGPDTPIVVSLDSHANVDARLLSLADIATCYRTYPHVDMVETGARGYALLVRHRRAGVKPLLSCQRIPFLIPILSQSTMGEPARGIYDVLARMEHELGCDANFATGFPAADVPHCGPTVWAYGVQGAVAVQRMFDAIVKQRPAWRVTVPESAQAVSAALRLAQEGASQCTGPVVVADPQDNPGAGTSGSTTGLLHALLDAGAGILWPGRVAVGLLNDPKAAGAAASAGVGGTVELSVGASVRTWTGELSPAPVTGCFKVLAVRHDPVRLTGPMMTGTVVELGVSACLELEGILICVCSVSTQVLDRSLFRALGVEPDQMAIVVLKSAVHFRADFEPISKGIIIAKSPGEMAAQPADLPWARLRCEVASAC